ncbi:hypothetical protein RB195_011806 [Necator americanus]
MKSVSSNGEREEKEEEEEEAVRPTAGLPAISDSHVFQHRGEAFVNGLCQLPSTSLEIEENSTGKSLKSSSDKGG